ncbi:DJ-1/PfpI/YhbO family deglycase/protease [Hydrogenimonas urashimensis]|uniref:DJ-1/PfpI/YhbO family deglycase/protease n=1 Tax=Hydrogenimonas urashimensis TaxID=2740515 RepID=UPI0019152F36|nr:type 1 glutamine amidotransferase domain-containing protein [Hydrogenimonas urashimensis]
MRALIITADGFEESELQVPYERLRQEGIEVHIASFEKGRIVGKHGGEAQADKSLDEVDTDAYDVLILPGGKAPEVLRKEPRVLRIVQRFFEQDKPVAAICHGPLILLSAGVLHGKHATCYHKVAEKLKKAGVRYEDKEVVVDGNLITSRHPADLDAFVREILRHLRKREKSS